MRIVLIAIAFVSFAAFLAILAYEVPSPDLIAVIVLTLALLAYDFAKSIRGSGNGRR